MKDSLWPEFKRNCAEMNTIFKPFLRAAVGELDPHNKYADIRCLLDGMQLYYYSTPRKLPATCRN